MSRMIALLAILALVLAACGGDEGTTGAATTDSLGEELEEALEDDTPEELPDPETVEEEAQEMADEMAEDLEDLQEAEGGGSATLTVGGETWEFDSVLCAFGPDEIGQEGAEFVLSALQDGLQLYVSIDSFGHSVTLDDIQDFENPSVGLSADPFTAQFLGNPEEFIEVDGRDVSAEVAFDDTTTDDIEGTEGTLTATCP